MGAFTDFAENKIIDALFRGQALGVPATWYVALIAAPEWAASTAYNVGDYVVTGTPTNGRLYKCTTAGTSGTSAPTWPTTAGGTVTDGTVVWTEQTPDLEAGTFPEATGGGYARVGVAASLTEWAGTQGAGTTTASSGTSGTTSNNNAITFPAPTGDWGTGRMVGAVWMDAATGGNAWGYSIFDTPKTVNNGDPAPSFAAAALSFQVDS